MTDHKALLELAERVEKASGPDRELDLLIWLQVGERLGEHVEKDGKLRSGGEHGPHFKPSEIWNGKTLKDAYLAFPTDIVGLTRTWGVPLITASLDAAMTLVPKGWLVEKQGEYPFPDIENRPFFAGLRPRIFGDARRVFVLDAAAPALALTAACLRALANGGNHG